jgi:hypothetical protein
MKKTACISVMLMVVLMGTVSMAVASECSGGWRVLPNYRGGGGACAAIGLNTHQAVCQPGQRYATYCDDASGGRYRICQSNISCYGGGYRDDYGYRDHDDDWRDDRREWRYDRREKRHDWRESRRDDYRDERRVYGFDCSQWDYQANRPCPPGTVNRDCRNDCGRIW